MDCQEAMEMAGRQWDDDLSTLEQSDLQLHLAACPDCRRRMAALTTLRRALTMARQNPLEPPSGLAANVMKRVGSAPRLGLAVARTRGTVARKLEEAAYAFKTPGRLRTAVAAAALALITIVTGTSLYLTHLAAPVTVAQNGPPPVAVRPEPAPSSVQPGPSVTSRPAVVLPRPPVSQPPSDNQARTASTGTMTSVWLSADNLQAVNRQLITAAAHYNADYHVYSLAGAPGGQNREFVRIAVDPQASAAIMDKIRSSAAAIDRVVQNNAGSGSKDVILAFVNGSSR